MLLNLVEIDFSTNFLKIFTNFMRQLLKDCVF